MFAITYNVCFKCWKMEGAYGLYIIICGRLLFCFLIH